MMMTDSIDTNIVLRCILGDVPEQREAAVKLLNAPEATHYLSDQALSECMYVLEITMDLPREDVVDFMNFFLTRYDGIIIYNRTLTKLAFPVYLTHPKLSWNDCALAAEAEINHHEPLFTFDKALARQLPQVKLVG